MADEVTPTRPVGSPVECAVGRLVPERRADGMPASSDERHLRRLLAVSTGVPHTYYDDGEAFAQAPEFGISIDFMREPVADIDAKLRALNVAKLYAAEKLPPLQQPVPDSQPLLPPGSKTPTQM